MFNVSYDTFSGFNTLGIRITAGHGNSRLNNIAVIHKRLIF